MSSAGKARLRGRRAAGLAALAFAFASGLSQPHAAGAGELLLGPGDKVAISVFKRPDMSGEFRIQPGGDLAMPFIKALPLSGRTLVEARDAIVERLRSEASLLDPRVSIDMIEARPVFVAGEVRRPGSYPFQPGMTVQHAISAAGGLRTLELDQFNARAEIARQRERLRHSLDEYGMALLRGARVAAERGGLSEIAVPQGMQSWLTEARLREGLASESGQLAQRTAAYKSQAEILKRQMRIFEEEIEALADQSAAKVRESDLVRQEAAYQEQLQSKGLSPRTSRTIELQRIAVQIEGERRQIAAGVAKARQEIARVEQALLLLENLRQTELASTAREAGDALASLKIAIEETRAVLLEANEILPEPSAARPASGFSILRTRGEESVAVAAVAGTPLQPGDLIEVPKR